MADNEAVKPGDPGAPPPPASGTPPAGDPPNTSPEAGVKGPDGMPLTFADVIKHPEFQPYLQRQIQDEVIARTTDTVAKVLEQAGIVKPAAKEDPDEEDVKHLMANFEDMDEKRARQLVEWRNRGIDKKTRTLENRFDNLDLSMRFSQVFRENEDARQYEGKMLELFNGMNDDERRFVIRSKDGAAYLYEQAKKRAGVLPASSRVAGGGAGPSASRSVPVSDKTGDRDKQAGEAVAALLKGNRAEFERLMPGVMRK